MDDTLEDLQFILKVLQDLTVDHERYDFGPSYEIAKSDKKKAVSKLKKIIKEIKREEYV